MKRCRLPLKDGCDRTPGGARAEPIGFGFERRILNDGQTSVVRNADATGTLLDDVNQFVAEQRLSLRRRRVVLPWAK